jgi:hypothetical protein
LESKEPQAANASGEAMTRRKGEITRSDLKRKWPIHLPLPAEKVRDLVNRDVIFCAAGVPSATPLSGVLLCQAGRRGGVGEGFGGKRLPVNLAVNPKAAGETAF